MTLISLLVGMMISLFCISGSLVPYKNLVNVASDTQLSSIYDGQLASALLTTQLELQNAGYGITSNGVAQVATASNGDNVDIYWRYMLGTSVVCRGLRDTLVNSARSFQIIEATGASCTSSSALGGLTWSAGQTLAQFQRITAPILSISVTTQNCWPYGAGLKSAHSVVTITAKSAAQLANNSAGTDYTFCLPNT